MFRAGGGVCFHFDTGRLGARTSSALLLLAEVACCVLVGSSLSARLSATSWAAVSNNGSTMSINLCVPLRKRKSGGSCLSFGRLTCTGGPVHRPCANHAPSLQMPSATLHLLHTTRRPVHVSWCSDCTNLRYQRSLAATMGIGGGSGMSVLA